MSKHYIIHLKYTQFYLSKVFKNKNTKRNRKRQPYKKWATDLNRQLNMNSCLIQTVIREMH